MLLPYAHPTQGISLMLSTPSYDKGDLILRESPILKARGREDLLQQLDSLDERRQDAISRLNLSATQDSREMTEQFRRWITDYAKTKSWEERHPSHNRKQWIADMLRRVLVCEMNAREITTDSTTTLDGDKPLESPSYQAMQHSLIFDISDEDTNSLHSSNLGLTSLPESLMRDGCLLVYETASLPSHSCFPSAFLFVNPSTYHAEIRLLQDVNKANVPISINYTGREYLPRRLRRQLLLTSRGLDCNCEMCIGISIPEYSEPGICDTCDQGAPSYRFHAANMWKCLNCGTETACAQSTARGVLYWKRAWKDFLEDPDHSSINQLMTVLTDYYHDLSSSYFGCLPRLNGEVFGAGAGVHISHSVIYNNIKEMFLNGEIGQKWGSDATWASVCYMVGVGKLITMFIGPSSEENRWSCYWLIQTAGDQPQKRKWRKKAISRWRQAMRLTRGVSS